MYILAFNSASVASITVDAGTVNAESEIPSPLLQRMSKQPVSGTPGVTNQPSV